MKKVFKFVKGKRDEKKESGGITPSQSGDLTSPAQTPEDERFLGLDSSSGYIVDFCGKDKTLTKLHKAAWQGSLDKLKSALKKVEIDAVDRHNRSALHFAVSQGHPNIVWFLLGNNAKMTICDDEGRTPLLKAIECGHKECMTLLLERGADINNTDYSGNTGLHIAAKQGSLDIASALLQRGADFEISNNCGEYPLHIATRGQNKDLVELLLRCGASVNVFDRENRTPLMLAAKTGNLLLAQLFFEYGAQLTVVDSNGWTAEDYALLGGHQNVASELKTLIKNEGAKTDGFPLETHNEEDEADLPKSNENSGTWNDSQMSEISEPKDPLSKKLEQFFKKCSDEALDNENEKDKDEDLPDSPSGVVPPPCQPPRSWDIIQAGMIDDNKEGVEPKRRSITTLGTLHSRRESFTEALANNTQNEVPRYTLSLNRRKDVKRNNSFAKQRLSFNEEESLKSWINEDGTMKELEKIDLDSILNFGSIKPKKRNSSSESDWDSGAGSELEDIKERIQKSKDISIKKKDKYLSRASPIDMVSTDSESVKTDGTLGRRETLQNVDEIWVTNESMEKDSSWDSESTEKDPMFPPPPSALELGVDMAKSMSFIKGVSIDHPPGSVMERNVWKNAYESQSHSLDCLDEKEPVNLDKPIPSKRHHSRHQSISAQKWRSEEIPQCQRPVDRLIDVNRRINEQLECYDQALRELAESSYAKKQDALISTLTSEKSKAQNYYSLPASKFKQSKKIKPLQLPSGNEAAVNFVTDHNYYYDKPPFGSKPFIEMGSGPISLPFFVNDEFDRPKPIEVENNETLGSEDIQKPSTLEFKPKEEAKENLESPMSDDQSGSTTGSDKGEKKTKRHMLLAMRDVKHEIQVVSSFKSSIDDQILSPLTKTEDNFDLDEKKLSPKAASSSSEGTSPGDENPFFRAEVRNNMFGRQETVIERPEYRRKSSSSGEEPTLWLQDEKRDSEPESKPTHERKSSFSPLGVVYREIKSETRKEKRSKKSGSISSVDDTSSSSHSDKEIMNILQNTPNKDLGRLSSGGGDDVDEEEEEVEEEEDDDEQNQENIQDLPSPDISLSSGPIEPLGTGKDSGSEPESSHNDVTPTHNYSLKNHHEWLKNHLKTATTEKNQLEEIAAQLSEKAERLQYELSDAKEAAKSKDEVILLLKGQLSRMETAYTKSLEESVQCRLQLTSLEQEILHLKELCFKYEEEKEKAAVEENENECQELRARIKCLEEENVKMKKDILRLEQEKSALEKRLQEATTAEIIDQCQRWKERCENLEQAIQENDKAQSVYETYVKSLNKEHTEREETLKERNHELERKLLEISEKNIELNSKLHNLMSEMESAMRKNSTASKKEINDSICELNKKNNEIQIHLKSLQKELEEKNLKEMKDKEKEVRGLIERFGKEREALIASYEKKLSEKGGSEAAEELKAENEKLKSAILNLQEQFTNAQIKSCLEESNESLKSELILLKDTVSKSISDIQNKDKQELDTLMKENLNLKKEINELKIKLIKDDNDVPNFKLELLQVVQENTNIKSEIFELKSELENLKENLTAEKQLVWDYKLKNANLEQNIKRLSDAKESKKIGEGGEARVSKKREVGKEDELAWNNLYGIKTVGKARDELLNLDKPDGATCEYSKIQKLELEFERTKEEIAKQKLDLTFSVTSENKARELKQNCELLELKRQIIALQNKMSDEKSVRCALENKIAEISLDLKDKEKLETELNALRRRLEKEFVPKTELELLKYRKEVEGKKQRYFEVNDTKGMDPELKEKCERLAKERERSKQLEKKINCYEPVNVKEVKAKSSGGVILNTGALSSSQFVPVAKLEQDIKSKLEEELDKSIKKHLSDPSSSQSTSNVQIEFLKKKYLN